MANSEAVTQQQAAALEGSYQADRYGSSASNGFSLSNSNASDILSVSSDATLGFDFGADSSGNYRPVAFAVNNTSGAELSGTKFFSEGGEISRSTYLSYTANYQANRDSGTPSGQNGTMFERSNIQALVSASASPSLSIGYARESSGALNFVVSGSSPDIGTVYYNRSRPRPLPGS